MTGAAAGVVLLFAALLLAGCVWLACDLLRDAAERHSAHLRFAYEV